MNVDEYLYKICLIGDKAVGKTSLVQRFVYSRFSEGYISTLGTAISKKVTTAMDYKTKKKVKVKLLIWDIAGQEHFKKIHQAGINGSNAAFVVVDLSRIETLQNLDYWFDAISKAAGNIPAIVIANKSDLTQKAFGEEELKKATIGYTEHFIITSAKTGEMVRDAFLKLAELTLNDSITPPAAVAKEPSVQPIVLPAKLNLLELEDNIIMEFCEFIGDIELGMNIVRNQFDQLGIDFQRPTGRDMKNLLAALVETAYEFRAPEEVKELKNNLVLAVENSIIND